MENLSTISINCCFCDKNLSSDNNTKSKSVFRYKCPACERLYCSAHCFGGHKEKFSCSGIRNKTPYVPISRFDQKQFLDDYFFLEEVNNKVETLNKILPELYKNYKSNKTCPSKKRKNRNFRSKKQNHTTKQQPVSDTQQQQQQQ